MIEKELGESFDVQPGAVLRLRHGDGDVAVRSWGRDTVQIVARYRAEAKTTSPEKLRDFEVEFEQRGRAIVVTGREPSVPGFGTTQLQVHEYRYTVLAPSWVELDLHGKDGGVSLEDWKAPVSLRAEDGSFLIDGLEAPSLSYRGEDATLKLTGIRVPRVDVVLEDGQVDLQLLAAGELDLRIRGKDARVNVTLEKTISAAFSIQHEDGSVEIKIPGEHQVSSDGRSSTGQVGDGRGGEIRVAVEDGRVRLAQSA